MAGDLVFGISLEDMVSAPAHKAARAVEELSNDLKAAKSQLGFFQSQLNLAKQLGDVEGYRKFSDAVAKSRREVFDLGSELGQAPKHAKGFLTIRDPAEIAHNALEGVTAGVRGMASAFKGGDAQGVIEGASESLAGLAQALDLVYPGLGQVAAATIKLGGAFASVIAGGVELALEVNAFNNQLRATFDALGKGPEAGEKTLGMIDDLSRELPQSREEIAKFAREAAKMGITDVGEMRQEILATASAQAILGEEGAGAYQRISRKVQDAIEGNHALKIASKELTKTIGTNLSADVAGKMGLSLETLEAGLKAGTIDARKFGIALEETLIEKGGSGLDAMWQKSGAITKKLKESFGELFADVDTKPITQAMQNLLALFDQTQPSGQAAKSNITDAFNGIVRAIGSAITEGEVFFLELEVWALSAKLAFKDILAVIKQIGAALDAINPAGALGQKLGGMVQLPSAPEAPKTVADMKMDAIAKPLGAIQTVLDPVGSLLSSKGVEVGTALGQGLTGGMLAMLDPVGLAGQKLGEAAAQGARAGAQVHSPSRLTMKVGEYMALGLAEGMVNSSAPESAGRQLSGNALGGMVGQALTSPPANQNGGGGVSISGLTVHITAPQGVTDATGLSATGLVMALEKLQLASGR